MSEVEFIRELGIPRFYSEYEQLLMAVELAVEDNRRVLNLYRDIYAVIGEQYGIQAKGVEKNISTVLQAAWSRNQYTQKQYEKMAGYPCPKRPTTSEFLDVVVKYLCGLKDEETFKNRKGTAVKTL